MILSRKIILILSCGLLLIAGSLLAGKSAKTKAKAKTTVVQTTSDANSKNEPTSNTVVSSTSSADQSVVLRSTLAPSLTASPATGETIGWQVLSGGGNRATSTNFIVSGTVGQTAVGRVTSTNFGIQQGFWVGFSSGCCIARGNVDDIVGPAGPVDVSDLTYLVAFLFKGGPAAPCEEQGNVDGIIGPAGPIDVSDLTYLVAFLFKGGPAPPAC